MNLRTHEGESIDIIFDDGARLTGVLDTMWEPYDEGILLPFEKDNPHFKTLFCVQYPTHFDVKKIKFFRELNGKKSEQDLFTSQQPAANNRI
jgi:hypothetical protein